MPFDVLTYGRPELRRPAVPVVAFTRALRSLAEDMLAAMYAHRGMGLAAPQIGRTEALCVVDIRSALKPAETPLETPAMPLILVNPRITAQRGTEKAQEGCLSFPEIYAMIPRSREIVLMYQNLDGRTLTLFAQGLLSRVIQHEVDHLQGRLIVDHMSAAQKAALAGRLRRLKAHAQPVAVSP